MNQIPALGIRKPARAPDSHYKTMNIFGVRREPARGFNLLRAEGNPHFPRPKDACDVNS